MVLQYCPCVACCAVFTLASGQDSNVKLTPWRCSVHKGLEQHLEASHDMFMYGYSDEANALRTVVVEPKEELYSPSGEFQVLESDALRDPVNKVNLLCQS